MSKAKDKINRMRQALAHQEPDRVPVGEFFWTGFLKRCKAKWGEDFDPYRHFDLDYIVITPNMDPRIQAFEVTELPDETTLIKTGFGATIRRTRDNPMPHYDTFSVTAPEQMADFVFDAPDDARRFHAGGDDQLNCVGDALARDLPPWDQRLDAYTSDFAVYGSVCEPYEYLWRIIGSVNSLMWMTMAPDELTAFVERLGRFLLDFTAAQIKAGKGRLSGMYLWGDVAYVHGMLFGAERWRELLKPHVKALIDLCHAHNLPVIYHGCGDARDIYEDLVEIGLDAYNPLEAKAGLDVVRLKPRYAGRMAFVGNIDVRVLERGNPAEIREHVRYKLQAARGGGWVFQSDHSVTSNVAPESYETALAALRESGNYPLRGD